MTFWRYKLLELVVAVATFPLFIASGFLVFALAAQVLHFETSNVAFFAVAIPFLVAWLIVQYRLTKRAERWWLARHPQAR